MPTKAPTLGENTSIALPLVMSLLGFAATCGVVWYQNGANAKDIDELKVQNQASIGAVEADVAAVRKETHDALHQQGDRIIELHGKVEKIEGQVQFIYDAVKRSQEHRK